MWSRVIVNVLTRKSMMITVLITNIFCPHHPTLLQLDPRGVCLAQWKTGVRTRYFLIKISMSIFMKSY